MPACAPEDPSAGAVSAPQQIGDYIPPASPAAIFLDGSHRPAGGSGALPV